MSDSDLAYRAQLIVLENSKSSLAQILEALSGLESGPHSGETVRFGISSSITVELLGVYLRKHAFLAGRRVEILAGNFDDPLGDLQRFSQQAAEYVLLLPFFDSLLPAFEARLPAMSEAEIAAKENEFRHRLQLVFSGSEWLRSLFVGRLHRFSKSALFFGSDRIDDTVLRFNRVLQELAQQYQHVRLLDLAQVVQRIGLPAAFDPRFYYRGQAPYTTVFMDELARRILVASRAFGSRFLKALVLDCDNTLWGGVVGEEGVGGVHLGPYDHPGNIYWRLQHLFLELQKRGVLLCLCSKNNPEDVLEVLGSHPHRVLLAEHFTVMKLNWHDKVQNLQEIGRELNLDLDSLVFLDDSDFECEAVRNRLPSVKTLQVPKNLSAYPDLGIELQELFLAGNESGFLAGADNTGHYRVRAQALESRKNFSSHQEYLASLALKVQMSCNQLQHLGRISELSLKSNQFNLTTRRYSEHDLLHRIQEQQWDIYSLEVQDRFGSSGLTGVVMVSYKEQVATIEAFFMSCRVLGRGLEFSPWKCLAAAAVIRGCRELKASYQATAKNAQVADFYSLLGLKLQSDGPISKDYLVRLAEFEPPAVPWIEVCSA